MKKYHITTVGNALLDMEYQVNDDFLILNDIEKGVQTLQNHDEHMKLLDALKGRQSHNAAGGACTNSLVAAGHLGAHNFYHCQVGNDEHAQTILASLAEAQIKTSPIETIQKDGHTGKCIVLITPDAERTMLTYLGVSADIAADSVDQAAIDQAEYFLVEGFQCISDESRAANIAAIKAAHAAGTKIALSFCDEAVVQYFHSQITELTAAAPIDILFCNHHEAMIFTNTKTTAEAAQALKQIATTFAMTLGPKGALIYDGKDTFEIKGQPVNATDTLGAGDLFAGVFLYGLTHSLNYHQAGQLANEAAAELVMHFGPRLPASQLQNIFTRFSEE